MVGQTRERIVDAAIELFHRKGFNATSLREIADHVGLQVGSLYNHIASKEDLLFDIMHGVMTSLIENIEESLERAGDDPIDRLQAFFETSIRFHAMYRQQTFIGNSELRGLSDEHRREVIALRDTYEALFTQELEAVARIPGTEVGDIHLATFAGLALCTSVATWYREGGRLALDDIVADLPHLYAPLQGAARLQHATAATTDTTI